MKPSSRALLFLTKRVPFCAAHRLYNPEWGEEKNAEVFGKCATPGGHGHNYVLDVTVKGRLNPATGMVIDLKFVKTTILREFWSRCDHRDMNEDVDFMKGIIPTAENIAVAAWGVLAPHFPVDTLHRIRLYETERNYVDYYGPDEDV